MGDRSESTEDSRGDIVGQVSTQCGCTLTMEPQPNSPVTVAFLAPGGQVEVEAGGDAFGLCPQIGHRPLTKPRRATTPKTSQQCVDHSGPVVIGQVT